MTIIPEPSAVAPEGAKDADIPLRPDGSLLIWAFGVDAAKVQGEVKGAGHHIAIDHEA